MDMVAQYRSIQSEIDEAIRQVLEAGQFILGPNVAALEKEIATYLGVKRGVACLGTDALLLAMRALGIGSGDEVIGPCLHVLCYCWCRAFGRSNTGLRRRRAPTIQSM